MIGTPQRLSMFHVLGVCLGAALLLACPRSSVAPGARANLVLIVIDTLRADHVSAYGYERDTSPELDALAARGMRFARASAPSSWTKPSVASLFTSRLPSEHGMATISSSLPPDVETVAELLGRAGYRCLGVSSNFIHVDEKSGLNRGFDAWSTLKTRVYDEGADFIVGPKKGSKRKKLAAVSAQEVNRELLRLLDSEPSRPVFLYIHYMEPHAGYVPPPDLRARFVRDPEFARGAPPATASFLNQLASGKSSLDEAGRVHLIDLYDAEIAAVDRGLGQLLEALHERGFDENTVYIVTSDHGEEFRDHGGWFHGLTLYEEALHVPLVVYDTRHPRGGAVHEGGVDLLDVPTTLLAVAGAERSPGMRGHDLLRPEALEANRERFAELHPTNIELILRPRAHAWAYARWPWKVVRIPGAGLEVFQLERDPLEREGIDVRARSVPPGLVKRATARAQAAALAWIKRNRGKGAPNAEPDRERLEELRALGYAE